MAGTPTDEMIEAGAKRLYECEMEVFADHEAVAEQIYLAMRSLDPALKECVERLEELQAEFCEYHCGTSISGPDHEPECDRACATLAAMTKGEE